MLVLYFVNDDQYFDYYILQYYVVVYVYSDLLYKGVNDDILVGVFSGMIKVDFDVQKIDVYQKYCMLMLSSEVCNFSVLQLEINVNDVCCLYGFMIGLVDQEVLFFLCLCGISWEVVEKMFVIVFLEDVFVWVLFQSVVKYIEGIIVEKVGVV